jgi:hypothetical protein
MSQFSSPLNKYHGTKSFLLRGIAVKPRIREKCQSGTQSSALRILDKSNRRLASGMHGSCRCAWAQPYAGETASGAGKLIVAAVGEDADSRSS